MAVKTMAASGAGKFNEGWHELTISNAEYGIYKAPDGDKRYISIHFDGYPDNMDLRIYEVKNKTTGEEFKIANLFRYANAGIIGVLKDPTGKKPVIQYDDEAQNLVGKSVNVFFYKEQKTGNGYSRLFDSVAPVAHEGEHLTFTDDQVTGIKAGVEKNWHRVHGTKTEGVGFGATTTNTATKTSDADLPF